jgi:lactoylglutathione lyase
MDTNTAVPQRATPRTQPESFRGRSLAASLTVSDLPRSLAWYRDVVGFTVDRKFEREGRLAAVALKAGGVELLLTQDDGAQGAQRVKGAGFSLMITTTQDVDAFAKRIEDRGGVLSSPPADVWGARAFRLQDPDGFRIAISSQRS